MKTTNHPFLFAISLFLLVPILAFSQTRSEQVDVKLGENYLRIFTATVDPGYRATISVDVKKAFWDVVDIYKGVRVYVKVTDGNNTLDSNYGNQHTEVTVYNDTKDTQYYIFYAKTDDSAPAGCDAIITGKIY